MGEGNVEYPERTKRIKMLRFLLEALRRIFLSGLNFLPLTFHYEWEFGRWTDIEIDGWYLPERRSDLLSIPAHLGLGIGECVSLLQQLSAEDYIYFFARSTERRERLEGPNLNDLDLS